MKSWNGKRWCSVLATLVISSAALLSACADDLDADLGSAGDDPVAQVESPAIIIPCSFDPRVIDNTFSTSSSVTANKPPSMLQKADIAYVPGEELYLSLHLRACVSIAQITENGVAVTQGGGIDSPSTTYSVVSDVSDGVAGHVIKIRLQFNNLHEGETGNWQVTTSSALVRATSTLDFRLAKVLSVGDDNVGPPPAYSISESDLLNALVVSLWNRYGVLGRDRIDPTSHVEDPDYPHIQVTINSSDVQFAMAMHNFINHDCRPLVNTTGRIRPRVEDGELAFTWVSGPSVDVPFDISCILQGDWIVAFFGQYVARIFDSLLDDLKTEVEKNLKEGLPCDTTCRLLLTGVSTSQSQLQASFNRDLVANGLPVDGVALVSILVPYRAVPANPGLSGLAIPANDRVAVFVKGTARACERLSGNPNTCASVIVGQGGLPNRDIPWEALQPGGWPIPDPSSCSNGTCGTNIGQLHARERLRTVSRPNSTVPQYAIPRPNDKIGNILFRRTGTGGSRLLGSSVPCVVQTTATQDRLYFGVNDQKLNATDQGTGSRIVTLEWTNANANLSAGFCQ